MILCRQVDDEWKVLSRMVGDNYPGRQCNTCRLQTSLTAGTMMANSKLPLRAWFLAMYLISQAKTGLSALALKRDLGVNYRTAWLVHQKIMGVMTRDDAQHGLVGDVVVDDAYLGREHSGKTG